MLGGGKRCRLLSGWAYINTKDHAISYDATIQTISCLWLYVELLGFEMRLLELRDWSIVHNSRSLMIM